MKTRKTILTIFTTILFTILIIQTTSTESLLITKTILLKARLNYEQLIKLLSIGNDYEFGEIYSKYIINETIVVSETTTIYLDKTIYVKNYRIITVYKLWYNPNYIIVIGEIDNNYVFITVIEQIVDNRYSFGRVNEIIISELGLLTYLEVIVEPNEILYVESLILNENQYLNKVLGRAIYTRPNWEQYLDSFLIRKGNVYQPNSTYAQTETPLNFRESYVSTYTTTSHVTENVESERATYTPLIYAFIIASLLSIIVYFIYKIL